MSELEQEFLANGGEWDKEFFLSDLFNVERGTRLTKGDRLSGDIPLVTAGEFAQGVKGFISNNEQAIYQNAITIDMFCNSFVHLKPFCCDDNILVLTPKNKMPQKAYFFISSIIDQAKSKFGYGKQYRLNSFNEHKIALPTKNNEPDFFFMDKVITELQAERLQELQGYLKAAGLSNYTLTDEEQIAVKQLEAVEWRTFNLENLFGKATRGKRLKSADRIPGNLPFVTAGEADTGISAFIGNQVEIFKKNTVTIDMFGSAKYRNYEYGADDHIAVVHCDNWDKHAVLPLTSAIHKVANAGQFSYGRNFYAKDADELNISLPVKDGKLDVELLALLGKAIEKLVIADVVKYTKREITLYKQVIV